MARCCGKRGVNVSLVQLRRVGGGDMYTGLDSMRQQAMRYLCAGVNKKGREVETEI